MPWKASAGTEVIPLLERSSVPPCVGQDPDRTSGAPLASQLKLQPPNPTVQGKAEALLDATRIHSSASNILEAPNDAEASDMKLEGPVLNCCSTALVLYLKGLVIDEIRNNASTIFQKLEVPENLVVKKKMGLKSFNSHL